MMIVRDLLDQKGRHIWSIKPGESVYAALQMMSDRHIGALMVTEGKELVGVLSERDYARKVILKGKSSKDTSVREIMTSRVIYVTPSQTVEDCMALMTNHGVRHLPVLDDGTLIGVISIGDVVKAKISNQEFIIEQLEHFIAGR